MGSVPLRRNHDFQLLWSARTVAVTALPIALAAGSVPFALIVLVHSSTGPGSP